MVWNLRIRKVIVFIVTAIMIAVPFFNLFSKGEILRWHIEQKDFYISGLQCIAFVVAIFLLCLLNRAKAACIMIVGATVFMLMQEIILPFLLAYVYFEIVCFIGFVVNRKFKKNDELLMNFITGLSVWGTSAIICSLLKHGTVNELRIMTVILLLLALLLNKEKYDILVARFSNFVAEKSKNSVSLLFIIFLVTLALIMLAKTNVAQDFDSLWYMLKPEYALIGETSFYNYMGYSAFVYYYPKLVELFFVPLSGFNDYSFLLAGNVMIYVILIVAGYKTLKKLCPQSEEYVRLIYLTVVFSIPALTSVVPSMKGDAFGALLTLCGVYLFLSFIESKDMAKLLSAVMCLFLSTGTKLTFLLWAGVAGIVMFFFFIYYYIKERKTKSYKWFNKEDIFLAGFGFFFIAGIHLRTLKLTGYPIYPSFLGLWNKLGFKAKPFMKVVSNSANVISVEEMPERFYKFFWDPSSLSHTVMCWPTNIVLILIIVAVVFLIGRKLEWDKRAKFLCLLSGMELALAFYYLLTKVQPDGNYFYFPILILCMTIFYLLHCIKDSDNVKGYSKCLVPALCMMLVLNFPLMYATNWAWALGIEQFSTQLIGENISDKEMDEKLYKQEGYYNIAMYIENNFSKNRVIISGDVCRIQGAVETTWSAFVDKWSNPDIMASYENFKMYVEYARIEGFIIRDTDSDSGKYKTYVMRLIEEVDGVEIIEDEHATLYIVKYY